MALKPLLLVPLLLSAFALAGCSGDDHGDDAHGEIHDVSIHGTPVAFDPKTITISAGHTVKWTNHETTVHSIVSTSSEAFSSPNLGSGKTFEHHFEKTGTFTYKCGKHASMTGTITVT